MPSRAARPRLGRWSTPVAFAVLAAAFFWPLWASHPDDRRMIGPADGDFLRQFYPFRAFAAGAWGSAHPPLWNPHQYAGTPALADPQVAVLYPWRLLQVPLAIGGRRLPLWAVELEAVAHVALGAILAWALARRLGAPAAAAAYAGIAFGFGGYLTGYPIDQLAVLDTAVWIPATLWALTTPVRAGGARSRAALRGAPGLAAGGATALAVLAGHPQTLLYALWAGTAWLAWQGVGDRSAWRRLATTFVTWLTAAAAWSAAQWLPALDFARRSARVVDPAEVAAGMPVADVIQLVAPAFSRTWRPDAVWGSQWVPLYVGAVALPLVVWGVRHVPATRFWAALAGGGWLVSLGGHGALFPVLLRILPGMAQFRHQERAAVLVSLGLAVAAALALGRLVADDPGGGRGRTQPGEGPEGGAPGGDPDGRPPHRDDAVSAAIAVGRLAAGLAGAAALAGAVLAVRPGLAATVGLARAEGTAYADALVFTALVAGGGAAAFALRGAGRISGRGLGLAICALAVFDLFSVNRGNALAPRRDVFAADALTAALAPRARDGRVSSEARLPGGANAASVFGLFDVTGDSPLQLGGPAALIDRAPEIVWWRLLGVRYVVTDRPVGDAPLAEIARTDRATLHEVRLPAPGAWVAARVVCEAAPEQGAAPIEGWARSDFDPHELVVVDRSAAMPADCDARTPRVEGTATLTALNELRVAVDATLERDGWLALSMAYDPGWRARARGADGRTVPVESVRAYGAITAVRLPAGRWTVEWTYRPNAVIVGGVLNLLALGAGVWWWRRSKPFSRRPEA